MKKPKELEKVPVTLETIQKIAVFHKTLILDCLSKYSSIDYAKKFFDGEWAGYQTAYTIAKYWGPYSLCFSPEDFHRKLVDYYPVSCEEEADGFLNACREIMSFVRTGLKVCVPVGCEL